MLYVLHFSQELRFSNWVRSKPKDKLASFSLAYNLERKSQAASSSGSHRTQHCTGFIDLNCPEFKAGKPENGLLCNRVFHFRTLPPLFLVLRFQLVCWRLVCWRQALYP